jgi:hypothetical protein
VALAVLHRELLAAWEDVSAPRGFHKNRMETFLIADGLLESIHFHKNRMETFSWDADRVQAFSAQMFGNKHRLEVALAILALRELDPQRVYKQALADALGVRDSEVAKHIKVFRDLELLEPYPSPRGPASRPAGRPPLVLRPTPDHFWDCLQELGDRFRRPPPGKKGKG